MKTNLMIINYDDLDNEDYFDDHNYDDDDDDD